MFWETNAEVTEASICNERAHLSLAAVVSDGQKSELSQILRIKALALHNVWRLWYRKRCPNRLGDNPWQTDMLAQRFRSSDKVFPNQVFQFSWDLKFSGTLRSTILKEIFVEVFDKFVKSSSTDSATWSWPGKMWSANNELSKGKCRGPARHLIGTCHLLQLATFTSLALTFSFIMDYSRKGGLHYLGNAPKNKGKEA